MGKLKESDIKIEDYGDHFGIEVGNLVLLNIWKDKSKYYIPRGIDIPPIEIKWGEPGLTDEEKWTMKAKIFMAHIEEHLSDIQQDTGKSVEPQCKICGKLLSDWLRRRNKRW